MRKTILFIFVICLIPHCFILGRLVGNTSNTGFDEENASSETASIACIDYNLNELIIYGGSNFMKAQAEIGHLSSLVELSDIEGTDFLALKTVSRDGLDKIGNAWYYFDLLSQKANVTPYNEEVIEKLKSFDYDRLVKEQSLNKTIMQEVKAYLGNGDIRGAYSKIVRDTAQLYFIMQEITSYINRYRLPRNRIMWNLNQQCMTIHLFGQYITRVFESL